MSVKKDEGNRERKKGYISELSIIDRSIGLEECFKKELGAKKILEYKKDQCSLRWVVWYI